MTGLCIYKGGEFELEISMHLLTCGSVMGRWGIGIRNSYFYSFAPTPFYLVCVDGEDNANVVQRRVGRRTYTTLICKSPNGFIYEIGGSRSYAWNVLIGKIRQRTPCLPSMYLFFPLSRFPYIAFLDIFSM